MIVEEKAKDTIKNQTGAIKNPQLVTVMRDHEMRGVIFKFFIATQTIVLFTEQ